MNVDQEKTYSDFIKKSFKDIRDNDSESDEPLCLSSIKNQDCDQKFTGMMHLAMKVDQIDEERDQFENQEELKEVEFENRQNYFSNDNCVNQPNCYSQRQQSPYE